MSILNPKRMSLRVSDASCAPSLTRMRPCPACLTVLLPLAQPAESAAALSAAAAAASQPALRQPRHQPLTAGATPHAAAAAHASTVVAAADAAAAIVVIAAASAVVSAVAVAVVAVNGRCITSQGDSVGLNTEHRTLLLKLPIACPS